MKRFKTRYSHGYGVDIIKDKNGPFVNYRAAVIAVGRAKKEAESSLTALKARIAELEEALKEARKEAFGEACKAQCYFCRKPQHYEPAFFDGATYLHKCVDSITHYNCEASKIRRALAEKEG